MLEALLGSGGSEKVLLFIESRGEGYAREIARSSGMSLNPVQRQLERLELGGILVSKAQGHTRLYSFNPEYPFLDELRQILAKALVLSGSRTPEAPNKQAQPAAARQAPAKSAGRLTQEELAAYVQERLRGNRD